MSLATRCPQCKTLFKVTSGQLQVHGGKVRCGSCQHVFSGIDNLISADTETWETVRIQGDHIADQASPPAPNFLNPDTQAKPRLTQGLAALQTTWQTAPLSWRVCMAMLALLLLLQGLWLVRKPMVTALGWPSFQNSSATTLRAFAATATQALNIEGSGLKAMDEDTLLVDITLRNSSRLPSHWPVLKLDLLDPQGLLLASKTLTPNEYQVLMRETTQVAANAKPIAPLRTVEIQAHLNLKELHQHLPEAAATGFRLALFDTL